MTNSPDFNRLRMEMTVLEPSNFDGDGNLLVASACVGCPIVQQVVKIHASSETEWFDIHSPRYMVTLTLEGVYKNCAGRYYDSTSKWRRLSDRVLGRVPLGVRVANLGRKANKTGTFHPCGANIKTTE